MRLFSRFFNRMSERSAVQMASVINDHYISWNGNIYDSDIVRACMAPKVKAIGKLLATHVRTSITREGKEKIQINPEAYIRFLLEEPNPYMTGQKLQERLAAQLAINRNAFALIVRDDNGLPAQIYPIPCTSAEAVNVNGSVSFRFNMLNGEQYVFPYRDLIHIPEDVEAGSYFGRPIMPALAPLMEVVTTTDQGIVKAIKNSAVIRWLLKFATSQRDEDIKKATERFANSFMNIENGAGVAGVDAKADAIQIKPDTYTPNADQMQKTQDRIYALFNTNKSIVTSDWTEQQWAAYFEAEIEPALIAFQNEFTRKLFSRRERSQGNRIVFDAGGIDSETTATKLAYVQMVDRGALMRNEWRKKFHLAPVDGGDEPIFWQAPKQNEGK